MTEIYMIANAINMSIMSTYQIHTDTLSQPNKYNTDIYIYIYI